MISEGNEITESVGGFMKELGIEYAENWLHTPTPFERSGGLWPIRSGRNIAKPNYKVGSRIIPYYSIHIVKSGCVQFACKEGMAELCRNDLFCMFPNESYAYQIGAGDAELRMYWLALDGKQVPYLLDSLGLSRSQPILRGKGSDELFSILDELQAELRKTENKDPLILSAEMYRFFRELGASGAAGMSYSAPSEWLARSLEYIHMHYMDRISVEELAAQFGIHRSHFTKTFAAVNGIAPAGYIRRLKMNKAAEMLSTTSSSVTEIALTVGYPDLFSFTKAFTGHFGQSPSRYRDGTVIL
jgi:AraC-like DNA-binding protein